MAAMVLADKPPYARSWMRHEMARTRCTCGFASAWARRGRRVSSHLAQSHNWWGSRDRGLRWLPLSQTAAEEYNPNVTCCALSSS
jgi:hypothetical protein